ncbi:MAG TPA: hypothetical protein VKT80_08080, partial [Chloroflexota bacterium]|nr:hypothetical protein [Chloroflexota bacterium]
WFRYPGTNLEPVGFDQLWAQGTQLLPDPATGESRVSLLSDWFFREKSEYFCAGRAESWEFKVTGPAGQSYDDLLSFDASCDFFYNGSQPFIGPVSFVQFVGATFVQDCTFTNTLGTWTLAFFHNGVQVSLTGTGMTDMPEVESQARVRLRSSAPVIPPEIPNVGIDSPGSPPGLATITASVLDPVCHVGIANVPLMMPFEFVAGSGGHTHLTADRIATPIASENTPIQTITIPKGQTASYDPIAGQVNGTTDANGDVIVMATAGQVSGLVNVAAIVTTPPSGTYNFNPLDSGSMSVQIDGLGVLPGSSHYQLVGSRKYPPPGAFGQNHDDNHFVDAGIVDRLQGMASQFASDWLFALQYNDSSLQFGGLFDVDGSLNPPHVLHRAG